MNSSSNAMASPMKAGFFQTLEYPSQNEILIRDKIYGDHKISEPILVELLQSPALLRLTGVCQHGVTGHLGLTPRVTRFEHSVGAFLLVRTVGASLEEQVAALLHDISHTTLSHVIDWALSKPGEGSFHEVHKSRYIKTTGLPQILENHGFGNLRALDEELFPLVERPSPHLCADRLDYSLRDAVGFGKLPLEDVQRLYAALKAFPDVSSPQRIFMLEDGQLALAFARAYLEIDRDVWSNPAHIDMYKRTGQLIGDMIRRGSVNDEDLWKLSDDEFWELLRNAAASREMESMKRLESEGLPKDIGLNLPQGTKIRTIDPDIYLPATKQLLPLSVVYPEWETEQREYIRAREALRV